MYPTIGPAKPKYWTGTITQNDDFGSKISSQFIDGRTHMGPWAIMSPASHKIYGVGLGKGMGQRYARQPDGRWLKVEG